ncbi:MAG: hypothetical protein DLM54_03535 [Acidimicrobiales bacterium]|nr:MAG: hypothetical protein DLM54_03535 [Acidimicrobiales bacterium]
MSDLLAMATGSPWHWHAHLGGWVAVVSLAGGYFLILRRLGPPGRRATPAQLGCFGAGVGVLAITVTWPVADLARHWLLLAHLVQQILLLLVIPPLILLGLPRWLIAMGTQPPPVEAFLRRLANPVVASVVFTVAAVGALLPPVVDAEAASSWVVAGVLVGLGIAGTVMWLPVLRVVPGHRHLSTVGRAGYLFVQSLLPNFPALVLIFSKHSLYPAFARTAALGLSPVADQQLAGVAAKVLGIAILWGAAGAILVKAQQAEEAGIDPDPLTWDDVEVELRRLERRPRRTDAT